MIANSRDAKFFSCQKWIALLSGVLSRMTAKDRSVCVGGPVFELIIQNHGNSTNPKTAYYQAARVVSDSIVGPADDVCLSAMLRICSIAEPVRRNEALMLIHASDIMSKAPRPGLVSSCALSHAVIACLKADQYKEALNLIE